MDFSNIMAPLSKPYCDYYYYLGIIGFVLLIYSIIVCVFDIFTVKDKSMVIKYCFINIVSAFFMYFINRLLYSMCVNSLV